MAGRTALPGTADVVIVGAGVMGASIAYFLSTTSDLKVAVVEKSTVAAGSTGDSSANIRHDYGDQRIYSELALRSHEFFREFEERTGHPLAYVPCPRVRFGKEGTREGEFIRAGYEVLRDLGVPAIRQSKDELEAAYPMFGDLCRFDFAIRDPTAAYSDATDAANGFVRAAIEAGATLSTGTEVEGFEVEDGAVAGVVTDAGTVECDAAVVAAGPWTPRLGEMVGVDIPITPSREDVFVLDPPPEFEPHVDDLPIVRFYGARRTGRPGSPRSSFRGRGSSPRPSAAKDRGTRRGLFKGVPGPCIPSEGGPDTSARPTGASERINGSLRQYNHTRHRL